MPRGGAATLESWEAAPGAALAELEPEFDAHWRGLGLAEQKTLRAVLAGGGSPHKVSVLQRLDLSKPTAQGALSRLQATADVERDGTRQAIVDPLLAEWIARL